MEEAILSWFNNVYLPVIRAIESRKILKSFKGRTLSDLYVFLIKYWDELKQRFGNDFPLEDAAEDFSKKYRKLSLYRRLKNFLARSKSSIYIMLDTLYYLKKGGRITPAAAALGTLLKIKPVLQIFDY